MRILYIQARNAESDGDYEKAAASFFALGMYKLAAETYRNCRSAREGLVELLRSIELDDRVGNETRAIRTAELLREHARPVVSEENRTIVRGLGCEWIADALLMSGAADATSHYRRAVDLFSCLDLETQCNWSECTAYKTASLALERFFDRRGIDYYELHDIDFAGRVDWKLTMCERFLE